MAENRFSYKTSMQAMMPPTYFMKSAGLFLNNNRLDSSNLNPYAGGG